ncbi:MULTISPECIES: hypothetical protein [unclassified Isoptericola]|uniref:hypothetical protein n=1 Tax=unclassified Isoptericola TaxID=2623355 RepID=UPI00364E08BD
MLHFTTLLALVRAYLIPPGQPQSDHARLDSSERGSVTIEHVVWAVAAIAFVGLAVVAIKAFLTTQAGKIT